MCTISLKSKDLGKMEEQYLRSLYIWGTEREWDLSCLKFRKETLSVGSKSHRWMPRTQRRLIQLMTLRKFRSVRNNNEVSQITFLHVQIGVFLR